MENWKNRIYNQLSEWWEQDVKYDDKLYKAFSIYLRQGDKPTFKEIEKQLEEEKNEYIDWVSEAMFASIPSDSLLWMLIIHRRNLEPVVLLPGWLRFDLELNIQKKLKRIKPQLSSIVKIKWHRKLTPEHIKRLGFRGSIQYNRQNKKIDTNIVGYPLDAFLEVVNRKVVRAMIHNRVASPKTKRGRKPK